MPKLDDTHLVSRITALIKKLEDGGELVLRDIKAVLTADEFKQVEQQWDEQKALRVKRSTRSVDCTAIVSLKTKRELYIDALKRATASAKEVSGEAWKRKIEQSNIRQAKIYFEALNEAEQLGKTKTAARNFANNELTRSGLRRMDGATRNYNNKRDSDVAEQERQIMERIKANMTDEERAQQELLEQHLEREKEK
jgi:hypothetical protein